MPKWPWWKYRPNNSVTSRIQKRLCSSRQKSLVGNCYVKLLLFLLFRVISNKGRCRCCKFPLRLRRYRSSAQCPWERRCWQTKQVHLWGHCEQGRKQTDMCAGRHTDIHTDTHRGTNPTWVNTIYKNSVTVMVKIRKFYTWLPFIAHRGRRD